MALTPGTRLGPYEITAQIGVGGMGEVYRATDTKLKREVAVKVLPSALAADPERLARLQREAEVLASLNHPNIAAIYGLEEAESTKALVMELVEGPTLADRIAQGAIPVDEALPIAKQIAEALEAAHEQGIIHRDLKPANVKLRPDGVVKVLDFGLAKALEPTGAMSPGMSQAPTITTPAMTQAGMILGTAAYMSPEQARGSALDRRADVWAFGVVLWEMLTGRRLFEGTTVSDTLAFVLTKDPEWETLPADTPSTTRQLLRRCVDRDAKRRLRDIGEARIALSGGVTESDSGRTGGGHLGWIAAGALLVVLVVLAVVMLLPGEDDPRIIRFTMAPPNGTSIAPGPAAPQLAVSPDGRNLAFAAVDSFGMSQIWIRDLSSMVSRPVPGTDGAMFPFWSPDSSVVGFQTTTHVKTVALAGGDVRTLSELDARNGATWSSDGVVVFAQVDGLYRVAAEGGIAERLTSLDESQREVAHLWPQFLPGGRHVLYFVRSPDEQHQGVYVVSLDGDEPRQVVSTLVRAVYAAGYLLFLRGDTLMAQPFDEARLQLAGTATPIAENVTYNQGTNRAGFSASDSGVLAFRTGGIGGTPTGELAWFDRRGNRLETLGLPGPYGSISLSPDDSRVAFERLDPRTGTMDIWIRDVNQGTESQFTFDEAADFAPQFSPDGTRLVFSSARNGEYGLYVKDASGAGAIERLSSFTVEPRTTDWSSSAHLVFELRSGRPIGGTGAIESESDLSALSLGGDQETMELLDSKANEQEGRVSPDGRWLAYVSNFSGQNEVYVAPFPRVEEGGTRRISTDGGTEPSWRGDGQELFYLDPENRLLAVRVDGDGPAFQYEGPVSLFQPNVTSFAFALRNTYAVTRDGERFVINVQEPGETPVAVVVNWLAELER